MIRRILTISLIILPLFLYGQTSGKLSGKRIVLTGAFSSISRNELKEKIMINGAKVSTSVSSKTDFVVYGKKPGSKLAKAKNFGVPILNEQQFIRLIS